MQIPMLYWEALLLRKAAQTLMFTGKHSESLRFREKSLSQMNFFAVSFAETYIVM